MLNSPKIPVKSKHSLKAAWLILTISLLLTITASYVSQYFSDRAAKERFEARAKEISKAISYRMNFYEQAIRGGVGFMNSTDKVDRDHFRKYVESLKLDDYLKGIQGIGYSVMVKPVELNAFQNSIRKEGFDDFKIHPEGIRDV